MTDQYKPKVIFWTRTLHDVSILVNTSVIVSSRKMQPYMTATTFCPRTHSLPHPTHSGWSTSPQMLGYPLGGGVSPTVRSMLCPQHIPLLTEKNSPNHFLALTPPPPSDSKRSLLSDGTIRARAGCPDPLHEPRVGRSMSPTASHTKSPQSQLYPSRILG
jgi:hypothetical protein